MSTVITANPHADTTILRIATDDLHEWFRSLPTVADGGQS